eukprot:CAMPEP_0117664738 /NCGR_PEP_ID=MMETSP0804-20121206/9396_1 /TAXON_ID=1074897 /ORGANISM="Tetraselmis astigmatica, Strain CCMP880" /LENGTH=36 /DNA_ID= /DNA_START= /DNA_END= /DNA_ORIENTATION=
MGKQQGGGAAMEAEGLKGQARGEMLALPAWLYQVGG